MLTSRSALSSVNSTYPLGSPATGIAARHATTFQLRVRQVTHAHYCLHGSAMAFGKFFSIFHSNFHSHLQKPSPNPTKYFDHRSFLFAFGTTSTFLPCHFAHFRSAPKLPICTVRILKNAASPAQLSILAF